tara:strand:- start:3923 stop:5221 length:1299 start_codon:yes stop_codon:yes gene_type:complete
MIKKKIINNIEEYTSIDISKVEPKYGLSKEILYCYNCLMSNQRPNMCAEHEHKVETKKSTILFNKEGFCQACELSNKKEKIDWDQRKDELKKLLSKYRSKNGSYDVLVPGSGGKDSFYVAHKLKYEFGMNPLTCTFAPNINTEWGVKNFNSWLDAGFANYLYTSNPLIHRFITRLSLENILHPFQPWILGQKNFPTKFARSMNIPLVIYGENPAEYGNPNEKYYDDMQMEWHACKNKEEIYISGIDVKKIKKDYSLNNSDLEPYVPLSFDEFKKSKLKCVSWSYFEKWHPQNNYYYTVKNSNFKPSPERSSGTYSKYSGIDDKMDDLHYYTTRIKFGIGRAHYDVAQEIRSGDITTEEGKSLIKKYDGEYPSRFFDAISDYLSIDKKYDERFSKYFENPSFNKEYFDDLCDHFRSPHIWKKTNLGWELRSEV